MQTALETIEERCIMAMEGVPEETRKSFKDGTTIFERVLPGADRMYPDTDSAPIPLTEEYISSISETLPVDICDRYKQLANWGIPEDAKEYILKKNLVPLIEKIERELFWLTGYAMLKINLSFQKDLAIRWFLPCFAI
jgi:glutamyl-tRNA(Gln) amidotransferase subunit E